MTLQLQGSLAARGDTPLGDWCPMDRALQLVGNRTSLLLLREAFYGVTRFDRLCKRVGVTDAAAAQRLRELVAAGVLEKQPYREPGQRTRWEYVLTQAGHELMPVVVGLLQWGAVHATGDSGVRTTHADCGAEVQVAVRCAAGHDVDESELVITGGSGSS